ncbi:hypothetical protein HDV00_002287 [Rhizophlyctis rosea]|nr:hypothetical protein HDV00_002287 [Rhizophlyctis rosea]
MDLPSSLDDALPAPLYRSHVAELNALLRSAHLRRRTLYISQTLSTALLALLLLIISIWVAVAYHQYVVTVVCVVGILVLGATQPLVGQGWFAGVKEMVEEEGEDLVAEWNARAPAHARFEVEGAENLAVHPRWGVETEGPTEPELHVIILDLPLRRQAAEQAASNEVLLTPEGDGMMMAVKVIRSIH